MQLVGPQGVVRHPGAFCGQDALLQHYKGFCACLVALLYPVHRGCNGFLAFEEPAIGRSTRCWRRHSAADISLGIGIAGRRRIHDRSSSP